ncbi:MAG: ATP-binding cassette domain-containing protein, partial [Lachnospiraceae bacterium]|nr:ATP-binding cassette domain-containing protein [Lachnospiraceae bacterium]
MKTIVEVNAVEKSYGTTHVIDHCSFKIYEGEIYGLLGINGAGKTT